MYKMFKLFGRFFDKNAVENTVKETTQPKTNITQVKRSPVLFSTDKKHKTKSDGTPDIDAAVELNVKPVDNKPLDNKPVDGKTPIDVKLPVDGKKKSEVFVEPDKKKRR